MRFVVSRTSTKFSREVKPCDAAFRDTYVVRDWDTSRLTEESAWFVEFSTLTELVAFIEDHGDVVITKPFRVVDPTLLEIEIYDDYRE